MSSDPYRVIAKPGALIVPLLFFGFSLYQYLYVKQLPNSKTNLVLIEPVFILLTLFTILVLAQNVKLKRDGHQEEPASRPKPDETINWKRLRWFILITVLYVAFIPILGFIITNLAFLWVCMIYLQERRWKLLIIVPLAATAAIYFLFEVWVQNPLPPGLWAYFH